MKKRIKIKWTLTLFSAIMISTSFVFTQVQAQNKNEEKMNGFSKEKLEEKWAQFKKDKPFSDLLNDAQKKGFKKIEKENAQWGFEGEFVDNSGKTHPVLFCIYDFVKDVNNQKQNCSILWRKVDGNVYKAYVILPVGETNMEKAVQGATEWFSDEKGIQKAHSWNSRFLKCVQTGGTAPNIDQNIKNGKLTVGGKTYTISCPGFCMFSALCATTALGAGIAFAETGIGLAMAIIAATACGLPCSSCFGMCAIGSL